PRHQVIGDDQPDLPRQCAKRGQRALSRGCDRHMYSRLPQHGLADLQLKRVIVNEENVAQSVVFQSLTSHRAGTESNQQQTVRVLPVSTLLSAVSSPDAKSAGLNLHSGLSRVRARIVQKTGTRAHPKVTRGYGYCVTRATLPADLLLRAQPVLQWRATVT